MWVTAAGWCRLDHPVSLALRNIAALAGQEMDKRLSTSVIGLRRGLDEARSLHTSLRAEANELKAFIPVLIQGTVSGIQDALRQQVLLSDLCPQKSGPVSGGAT